MTMAKPLRNRKKKTVLFLGLMLQLQRRKATTCILKREANANNMSLENVRNMCKQGRLREAVEIMHVMDQPVDSSTYVCLLQCCCNNKALPEGKLIHAHINEKGIMTDRFLQNTLLSMYAKCWSLVDASRVFNQMNKRDVFSWNVMIAAYARHGFAEEALTLLHQMQRTGIQPNQFTFVSVLPACANLAALMDVHEEIKKSGFQYDVFVGSALVDMYAKCGSIQKARNVFDKIPQRDVVCWTAMIAGYSQTGHLGEALELFRKMPERNVVSWNAMITGYAQNGRVDEAQKLFQKMPARNVVSWNAMIGGYAQNGHCEEALKLFRQMQLAGVKPDSKTFASVLPAYANLAALEQGMEIHEEINRNGFQYDGFVANALVDMYAKCGSLEKARDLFDKMPQRDAVSMRAAGYGQNAHVDETPIFFPKMPKRDIVSWTAMIAGYARNGDAMEALELFKQMQVAGVKPDSKTFASVLPACANLAALEQGMEIHQEIVRSGFQSDVFVVNALVDMYAKCGNIETARHLFNKMHQRDVVSWTAMIAGYAMHGCGEEALELFEQMQNSGVNPNEVTLVCVLSACCHAGLLDDGQRYFNCMSQYYHITPAMEHYGCMVDLLGRAGHLDEARDFIYKMPIKPDATVWGCLLGACRIHKNIELGEYVAERLFELDPKDPAPYVLLSNTYATSGRWDGIEKVRKMMKDGGIKKTPGCSWIEVDKVVHAFLAGDV
eukprot:Gb_36918 [translate_table: standard]